MVRCSSAFLRCLRTTMSTRERAHARRLHARYRSFTAEETAAAGRDPAPSPTTPTSTFGERETPPHIHFDSFARVRGLPKQTELPADMGQRVEEAPAASVSHADSGSPAASDDGERTRTADDSQNNPLVENGEPDTAALHDFLLGTVDADAAWNVYEYLQDDARRGGARVPLVLLRRLLALIGRAKPHRRVYFLRLLNLAAAIRSRGALLRVEEWNSLIACAARGQRRKRVEDYQAALDVFRDMLSYFDAAKADAVLRGRGAAGLWSEEADTDRVDEFSSTLEVEEPAFVNNGVISAQSVTTTVAPGESHSVISAEVDELAGLSSESPDDAEERSGFSGDAEDGDVSAMGPDLHTYHILLHIAVLTSSKTTVRHATSLLLKSGFEPTWRTHAIMLPYFARQNRITAVRETVAQLVHGNSDVDVSVINACIWVYAREGSMDVAMLMYRVLHANTTLRPPDEAQVAERERLAELMGFEMPRNILPDVVTYRSLVQVLAYHGDLYAALLVFRDFMQSPCSIGPEPGVKWNMSSAEDDGHASRLYASVMPIYRSLFLGFARHGVAPVTMPDPETSDVPLMEQASFQSSWTLDNFQAVFDTFLQLDPRVDAPTERVVYWIIVALAKTSGSDARKMWHATNRIQQVFGPRWRGRLDHLLHTIMRGKDTGELVNFPDDIVKRGGWRP